MFREGQYLEVIKASENCLATAIITIKEKSVEIDKKKIFTNKWLNLEDWSSLYKIIQRAILRNSKVGHENDGSRSMERRKSTRRMDVIYSYEAPTDGTSLPTVRVRVSPAKRRRVEKSTKLDKELGENTLHAEEHRDSPEMKVKRLMEGLDEEYVPPVIPKCPKAQGELEYVPSRKSVLKQLKRYSCDEYTPATDSKVENGTDYVPNPISSLKRKPRHEVYEPSGASLLSPSVTEAYIPGSKGSSSGIEEYEPDFPTTTMQLDVTYVPSAKKRKNDGKKIEESASKYNRTESDSRDRKKVSKNKSSIGKHDL